MTSVRISDGAVLALTGVETSPVVFLHGGAGTAALHWGRRMRQLPARYEPIGVDLRGHGTSTGDIVGANLESIARDVEEVLTALGRPGGCHVVGFSMGACAALRAAISNPGHFRSLTLVGAHGRLPGGMARDSHQRFSRWATAEGQGLARFHPGAPPWPEFIAALAEMENDIPAEALPTLLVPTLVVHGDRDEFVPVRCALDLFEALPDAELAVLPAAGHLAQDDQRNLFDHVLSAFLDRVEAREERPGRPFAGHDTVRSKR